MAGLPSLFDDSGVLAHDSPVCRALACAAALALPDIASGVDCIVGARGARDAAVAAGFLLFEWLGLGPGNILVRRRILPLCEVRQEFQRAATWWAGGSPGWQPRSTTRYGRHSRAGAASGVSCASLRDAG